MEADGGRGEIRIRSSRSGPLPKVFASYRYRQIDPISKCARAQKDEQGFATLTEPWRRSV